MDDLRRALCAPCCAFARAPRILSHSGHDCRAASHAQQRRTIDIAAPAAPAAATTALWPGTGHGAAATATELSTSRHQGVRLGRARRRGPEAPAPVRRPANGTRQYEEISLHLSPLSSLTQSLNATIESGVDPVQVRDRSAPRATGAQCVWEPHESLRRQRERAAGSRIVLQAAEPRQDGRGLGFSLAPRLQHGLRVQDQAFQRPHQGGRARPRPVPAGQGRPQAAEPQVRHEQLRQHGESSRFSSAQPHGRLPGWDGSLSCLCLSL